ncbi:hypothetical protein [Nocardia sp. NPDC050406]|uniref:hypothetical protein n=1 Tax=Nocardia sp. NPDC050406 TaxID=3364318 RepID=UPI00378A388E
MTHELDEARRLLADGDAGSAVRALLPVAETAPLHDIVEVVRAASVTIGFDDLAEAAAAVLAQPRDPVALYHFGLNCTERGIAFLGVPALRQALEYAPDAPAVLTQLVYALERQYRHAEAAVLLAQHDSRLVPWPQRYLLVFNAVLADMLPLAREHFARLPEPDDEDWAPAYDRLRNILRRTETAASVTSLDHHDLRGWHFVVTGGYLATLSPFGFAAGMTGRWAYLQETYPQCRRTLDRLALILTASGRRPRTVSLLPDRDSHILGLAVARLLDIPAESFTPDATDTLVVAYDLHEVAEDLEPTLRERADGRVVYEHATCWVDPPAISADITGLLAQSVVTPWDGSLRVTPEHEVEQLPADDRPAAEIAADILAADGTDDPGDGDTPPDPDESLTAFVTATHEAWLTGPRFAIRSPGPVRSNSFG